MGYLVEIAGVFGTSEAAFRLITTLFSGYPLALAYRRWLFKADVWPQHVFFAISGFLLLVFNYGLNVWHSIFSVLVAYCLCRFLPGTTVSVAVGFIYLMGHLLFGYWYTESDQYDITWTMPQCILTLRLIGLIFDVYDGHRKHKNAVSSETSRKPQEDTSLTDYPGLLEIFAFTYFFGSFFVGPQYPLVRFRRFVNGEFADPKTGAPPNNIVPCVHRLVRGLIYLAFHQVFASYLTVDFFTRDSFLMAPLWWKYVLGAFWFRVTISRYQAVWLITEGTCILTTLSYNGVDAATGRAKWDGLRNIKLTTFEGGCSLQSIIESFNLNTNQWAAKYVFKRLRFLGNKTASHVSTLLFLAVWHGFHLGYFACFFFEFVSVIAERQLVEAVGRFGRLDAALRGGALRWPTWTACKLISTATQVYGFVPFGLIKKERWWPVYSSFYFSGWLAYCVIWPFFYHLILPLLTKRTKEPTLKQE